MLKKDKVDSFKEIIETYKSKIIQYTKNNFDTEKVIKDCKKWFIKDFQYNRLSSLSTLEKFNERLGFKLKDISKRMLNDFNLEEYIKRQNKKTALKVEKLKLFEEETNTDILDNLYREDRRKHKDQSKDNVNNDAIYLEPFKNDR